MMENQGKRTGTTDTASSTNRRDRRKNLSCRRCDRRNQYINERKC